MISVEHAQVRSMGQSLESPWKCPSLTLCPPSSLPSCGMRMLVAPQSLGPSQDNGLSPHKMGTFVVSQSVIPTVACGFAMDLLEGKYQM